jgi:hypothetical protein
VYAVVVTGWIYQPVIISVMTIDGLDARGGIDMSKFCFSVSNIESRRDGEIESDSFSDAVDELGRQIVVSKGDLLEIGVYGFPPARFECVGLIKTRPIWFPSGGRMAA